ncbi:MAG: hypothetical protein LC676_10945 [Loktanella sp.]|nr:hypothetical protein [Loktanella sp.]
MSLADQADFLRRIAAPGADGWIRLDGLFAPALDQIAYTILCLHGFNLEAILRERAGHRPGKAPKAKGPAVKMSLPDQEQFVRDIRNKMIMADGRVADWAWISPGPLFAKRIEAVALTLDFMAAYSMDTAIARKLEAISRGKSK